MQDPAAAAAPADIRFGIVRGISYGLFGKPDRFVPATHALGARFLRLFLFWGQIEPQPRVYSWSAVDALLEQLDDDDEVWVTLCSSSRWATRQPTDFLPPSPAHDLAVYRQFVRQVVRRCGGRVKYWQCDNEPSNVGLLWAGTAPEYVAQLESMFAAVREIDPDAYVVLGGCGYDVFTAAPESAARAFFDHVLEAGRDAFDLFDAHLYGDPYRLPDYVESARSMMRAHGYEKPIVAGEYAGPSFFEFPAAETALHQAMASAFTAAPVDLDTETLKKQVGQDTPERRAMRALYAGMADLPPRLQMFMAGCPPELEARRHRIACRQLVMRNLLALSAGIRRTLYWNLAPEVPGAVDPYMMMHLLVGKLPLLGYRGNSLDHRHPAAETFRLLTSMLCDVVDVRRTDDDRQSTVLAFTVQRRDREPLLVVWDRRDPFDGECAPPIRATLPWPAATALALDAFGQTQPADVRDGAVHLSVTDTPLFVSAAGAR